MNMARRNAITKMKKHVKGKLHNVHITKLKAITSTDDFKEATKQSQTGKCQGHSGITYEFWKLSRTGFLIRLKSKKVEIGQEKML